MCTSLTCSDLTECSARVLAKIPDARLRRERRLARSMERRPTHSIRTPDGSEQQSYLYLFTLYTAFFDASAVSRPSPQLVDRKITASVIYI